MHWAFLFQDTIFSITIFFKSYPQTTLELSVKKLICLLSLVLATNVSAASGKNGLGIIFGDPSGLTFQHRIDAKQFTDFYFAYTWDKEWIFMGDYKFRMHGLFDSKIPLTPYVGMGAFLKIEDRKHHDDVAFGVRIPLGIEWSGPEVPVTLFAELVPALKVIKRTDGDLQGGVGGRFFF